MSTTAKAAGPRRAALAELDEMQAEMNAWLSRMAADHNAAYGRLSAQVRALADAVAAQPGRGAGKVGPVAPVAAPHPGDDSIGGSLGGSAGGMGTRASGSAMATPVRMSADALLAGLDNRDSPALASPPISHALNYDSLIDDVEREVGLGADGGAYHHHHHHHDSSTRPMSAADDGARRGPADVHAPVPSARPGAPGGPSSALDLSHGSSAAGHGIATNGKPCHVLVEFKRRRILQFDSAGYVAPGEYVVVAGDRGEDIGLVIYSWPVGTAPNPPAGTKWNGVGVGKVTRVATILEVSQLQGVQAELENRAKEVAQQKVVEHQLPMQIVDAEYQFDRKKLTFYYQSQHRLDFRNLVRDLYKTFRARIWMELA